MPPTIPQKRRLHTKLSRIHANRMEWEMGDIVTVFHCYSIKTSLMKHLLLPTLTGCLLLIAACRKDAPLAPAEARYTTPDAMERASDRSACDVVVVPANSVNALKNAIASSCDGGIIYLKAGDHVENDALVINKGVKIIGETGAVLKIKAKLTLGDPASQSVSTNPSLHVLNAPGFLIQQVDIQPQADSDGTTALLIENSPRSAVIGCAITRFQFGVLVEKSDRVVVMRNKVTATSAWQTGQATNAFGITVINGKSAYISDNEVSNALFGIWACDQWGTCERNTARGNFIGIVLCKVPKSLKLPSGDIIGATSSAVLWKTRQNTASNNIDAGYLIVDGANNNLIEENNAANNGTYDYELAGDTPRFGFLAPASFSNTLRAKTGQKIKDCGLNNAISGGALVDTRTDVCK